MQDEKKMLIIHINNSVCKSTQRYKAKGAVSDFNHFAKGSRVGIILAVLNPLTFPLVSSAVAGLVWDLTSLLICPDCFESIT